MRKMFILGAFLCAILSSCRTTQKFTPDTKFAQAVNAITSSYVDSVSTDKLVENAIVGMLEKLDPHSLYIPKDEVKRMNEPLDGSFEGIGIQFQLLEDTLFVVQTISGGPSEKVGLLAGDRIVYVNDTLIAGVKLHDSDVFRKLRGKKGTEVNIKVLRRGIRGLMDFKIIRNKVPIYSLDAAYMINNETGYIRLNRFSATTTTEFTDALRKLKKKGLKNLILDLQSNGGGYLQAAKEIVDEFLEKDATIVYTEGAHQPKTHSIATSKGNFETGNLVVLVNEGSASASEVVSGAIQDWDRGLIVGRRTFGKGLVQNPIFLIDGSMLRLVCSRYYSPSGRCIQKPYMNGKYVEKEDKFSQEFIDRYNTHHMLATDSIIFPDSLRKETLRLKRTVYGGGGIFPDYYVPADTTVNTAYLRKVIGKGVLNKLALQYVDEKKKELQKVYSSFEYFKVNFEVNSDLEDALITTAEKEKIPFVKEEYEKSRLFLLCQIKALIARDLWGVNEYFEVINEQNEIYKKAIEIINSQGTPVQ